MDDIVQIKVNEAIAEERANHRKTEQELIRTKEYLKVSYSLNVDILNKQIIGCSILYFC
jgi:hypothetical protein